MDAANLRTPWKVESPKQDSRAFDVLDAQGMKVHHGHWGGKATSDLIAAAPEMYGALRVIEVLLAVGPGAKLLEIPEVAAAWGHARAAIAKAEGR